MRILLVKMSSLGDVFHTFPALTDAMNAISGLQVDWVVEEAFSEIPTWHPVVNQVFSIGLRRWRKHPLSSRAEVHHFFDKVKMQSYDKVIDAQGLLKSAWVARHFSPLKVGMDWPSAREPLASLFYDQKVHVPKNQHAIIRLRQLFAQALHYERYPERAQYGLKIDSRGFKTILEQKVAQQAFELKDYVVGLHGTTWDTKLWPEDYWVMLGQTLLSKGKQLILPWGEAAEKDRALRIQQQIESKCACYRKQIWIPDEKLSLNEMVALLKGAWGVVSVDTGLSHVAAALNVPMVVLYRVTDPTKIGAMGDKVHHLISPLAHQYLKKFKTQAQSDNSLKGLEVEAVLQKLFDRKIFH